MYRWCMAKKRIQWKMPGYYSIRKNSRPNQTRSQIRRDQHHFNSYNYSAIMSKKKLIENTTDHFETVFHSKPDHIFLSPGRINIIGEHVDYNDGFVLPAAINKYICLAVSENES